MKQFYAEFTRDNIKHFNPDLFNRTFELPLWESALRICQTLNDIPGIKLLGYDLVTDQTKIQFTLDKSHSKDPKIKNDRGLDFTIPPEATISDMLVLRFRISHDGAAKTVERKLLIPAPIPSKGNMILRNGVYCRPMIQIVDNTTFVKNNVVNFKNGLYSIKLGTKEVTLMTHDGQGIVANGFQLDLFNKLTNPLLYSFAQYGVQNTIEQFSMDRFMSIVGHVIDPETFYYFKIGKRLYLEVTRKAYDKFWFVSMFAATLFDIFVGPVTGKKAEKPSMTFDIINDKPYWKLKLSGLFSIKASVRRAKNVIVSYRKMTDITSRSQLKVRRLHRRNTFTVVRWMMMNYLKLLQKDGHDLKHKRIRANEAMVFSFDKHISQNVHSYLNSDPSTHNLDRLESLLKSINLDSLLRGMPGGISPTNMLWSERYNDMTALEACRYTLTGPTGINGGKESVSLAYRNIYPSHFGRIDVNFCSSNPGLSGYLTTNCKISKDGHFDENAKEPDDFDDEVAEAEKKYGIEGYVESRHDIRGIDMAKENKKPLTVYVRRMTQEEIQEAFIEKPNEHGLIRLGNRLFLNANVPKDKHGVTTVTLTSSITEIPRNTRRARKVTWLPGIPIVCTLTNRSIAEVLSKD